MKQRKRIREEHTSSEKVAHSGQSDTIRLTPAAKQQADALLAQWAAELLRAERSSTP